MEFLADENIPGPIIGRLRADGLTVHAVSEGYQGIDDLAVLNLAGGTELVVVTQDHDFGLLVFRRNASVVGHVLIELAKLSLAKQVKRVSGVFADRSIQFRDNFTVVEPSRVRIRPVADRGGA